MSIVVLLPTRDNPDLAQRAYQTMLDTSSEPHMMLCIDDDQAEAYAHLGGKRMRKHFGPRTDIVGSLNAAVRSHPEYTIYGQMTDDAVFLSDGWDSWTERAVDEFPGRLGVISPHHNGGRFVNFPYVSREWIETVGWFACPETLHFCWDTVLELLGEATCIRYAEPTEFGLHHYVDRNDKTVQVFLKDALQFLGWTVNRRRDILDKLRAEIACVKS